MGTAKGLHASGEVDKGSRAARAVTSRIWSMPMERSCPPAAPPSHRGANRRDLRQAAHDPQASAAAPSVRADPQAIAAANVKSMNYLNNILAKIEANYKGGDEAIFFDTNGYISEGSGDNLYVVKNGEIITPRP